MSIGSRFLGGPLQRVWARGGRAFFGGLVFAYREGAGWPCIFGGFFFAYCVGAWWPCPSGPFFLGAPCKESGRFNIGVAVLLAILFLPIGRAL